MISFFVAGEPIPKGSTKSFYTGGKVITTNANRRTKDWELRIGTEAQKLNATCTTEPVELLLFFRLSRPKSLPRKVQYHVRRPDLDKLIRACLDALTGILFRDDSQVCAIHATKRYVLDGQGSGVEIQLEEKT